MSDQANLPGKPGNTFGRWKPGQSGNPKGRPLSKPFKEMVNNLLNDNPDALRAMAAAMIAKAANGDVAAYKELADRIDGKVPNPIGGTDELPPITAFAWKPPDPLPEPIKTVIEDRKDDSPNDD